MKGVWKSLLWKEWREHRGTLAALTVIAVVVPMLLSLKHPLNIFGAVTFTLVLVVPLGSLFVGMHAAASEQSRGTIGYLQALPTSMVRPAIVKLLAAAVTIAVPIAAAVLGAAIWKVLIIDNRSNLVRSLVLEGIGAVWGLRDWYASTFVAAAAGGLSVLVWMAAAGVNRSDEVRAGAVGVLVILTCWAAVMLPVTVLGKNGGDPKDWPRWHRVLAAGAPGGAATVYPPQPHRPEEVALADVGWINFYWPFLAFSVATNVALAATYVARFGRVSAARREAADQSAATPAATPGWLSPPRSSRIAAIAWKQLRETTPLALLGAGIIVLATVWTAVQSRGSESLPEKVTGAAATVWISLGMFVAIVAGIGVFLDDLKPGLHTFWRSRPIPLRQWFAVKYVIALASMLVIMAIPTLAVLASLWGDLADAPARRQELFQMAALAPVMQACIFTVALAAMILVRQPIYASILTIGVMLASFAAIELTVRTWRPEDDAIMIALACSIPSLAALPLAWCALRQDWGWKG